ncbi:hypothetical protein AKJ38_03315 [candidate division MSBL1 archaeon SCGC-AAA259I14]|uniref:Uncharacterized protein n=1 Tax=candidate division MSBL1 archaeon SCGC-AAA259I14 TaxID=1698268 RepID=A0A133UQL8_9EURY|nr:hypothetical protein AKJ38_03315 [candidate division MSBL1 archaeon SCGC-AAA259I14]
MSVRYKITSRDSLFSFLKSLMGDYQVYGPTENEGPVETSNEYKFDRIYSLDQIALRHPPHYDTAEKVFFP